MYKENDVGVIVDYGPAVILLINLSHILIYSVVWQAEAVATTPPHWDYCWADRSSGAILAWKWNKLVNISFNQDWKSANCRTLKIRYNHYHGHFYNQTQLSNLHCSQQYKHDEARTLKLHVGNVVFKSKAIINQVLNMSYWKSISRKGAIFEQKSSLFKRDISVPLWDFILWCFKILNTIDDLVDCVAIWVTESRKISTNLVRISYYETVVYQMRVSSIAQYK